MGIRDRATTAPPSSQDEQPVPPARKAKHCKKKKKAVARGSGLRSTVAGDVLPAVIPAAEPEAAHPPEPAEDDDAADTHDRAVGDERAARREAESLGHLLTHKPKNPHCSICARTRARQVYRRSGSFHRELAAWEDLVTADHVDCRRSEMSGLDDQREALIIRDLYSGLIMVYPAPSKSTEDTIVPLYHYRGTHTVKFLYTDGASEFKRA